MKGFTLIELIVTVFIASVLLGISISSWQHFVIKNHVSTLVNRLMSEIYFARSEAIKRHISIVLCPTSNRKNCGGQWNESHLIAVNSNNNSFDHHQAFLNVNSTLILRIENPITKGTVLRWQSFANPSYIIFTPFGFSKTQNGTFIICPQNNDTHYAKAIIINKIGRIRLSQDNDHDGIDENAEGRALLC